MRRHRSVLVLETLLAAILAASAARAQDPANTHCPVLPDMQAKAKYTLEYKGRSVSFCCSDCLKAFEADPGQYEANLSGDTAAARRAGLLERAWELANLELLSWQPSPISPLFSLRPWMILLPALGLGGLWLRRRMERARGAPAAAARRNVRPMTAVAVLLGLSAAALAGFGYDQYVKHELLVLENHVHFATYYEFGDPPRPARPDVPKRLKASFYRGNDERDGELFNGGNYRTATFGLSLRGADGREFAYGDDAGGQELFLRLNIERAAHTPDYFWAPPRMRRMFMSAHGERFLGWLTPLDDRVDFTVVRDMQQWEGLYPLGRIPASGAQSMSGMVYVCEERFRGDLIAGARFHYGIAYTLALKDGVIQPDSDLWMGSLYRRRDEPNWKVPAREWFSASEIPVLPRKGTNDPRLLGITEHVDEDRRQERR
jgi:YHS domain-containing protein